MTLTYSREVEPYRHILEALSALYRTSVLEVHEMARRSSLQGLDPIRTEGNVFNFEHDGVPDPYAVVDLAVAWTRAKADAHRCAMTLRNNPSLKDALWVFRNSIAWSRFWSVRFPDFEYRQKFVEEVKAAQIQLEELEAKAWASGNCEAIESLSDLTLIEDKRR